MNAVKMLSKLQMFTLKDSQIGLFLKFLSNVDFFL
jgi:hypothetical protein